MPNPVALGSSSHYISSPVSFATNLFVNPTGRFSVPLRPISGPSASTIRQRRHVLRRATQCREIPLSAIRNRQILGISWGCEGKRVNINGLVQRAKYGIIIRVSAVRIRPPLPPKICFLPLGDKNLFCRAKPRKFARCIDPIAARSRSCRSVLASHRQVHCREPRLKILVFRVEFSCNPLRLRLCAARPNSHVPVAVCRSVGIRTRGRTVA